MTIQNNDILMLECVGLTHPVEGKKKRKKIVCLIYTF